MSHRVSCLFSASRVRTFLAGLEIGHLIRFKVAKSLSTWKGWIRSHVDNILKFVRTDLRRRASEVTVDSSLNSKRERARPAVQISCPRLQMPRLVTAFSIALLLIPMA